MLNNIKREELEAVLTIQTKYKYFSSEIDPFCNRVLDHHYDDIIHLGDIKAIKGKDLPRIDLLIGGSPCQDLSIAQKGKGLQGKNSSLFYEFVRLLNEINPKYFFIEYKQSKTRDESF